MRYTCARLLCALLPALFAVRTEAAATEEVTVFAAASTAAALEAVIERYASGPGAGRTGGRVRPVFAASSTLALQIEQGAPADLYLSASVDWMDYLEARKAIDPASRVDLLGNRLVLITPAERPLELDPAPGFPLAEALGEGRLAIGDPGHVPAGLYAKAALDSLGVWSAVADKTARAADVRGALALVDRGEAAAGIVYQSDLKLATRVAVAAVFPSGLHPPITYPLALVAGRRSPEAERFYRFLQQPEAVAIFRAYGFPGPGQAG
jgi:molybdate transport system substrate-binding protein